MKPRLMLGGPGRLGALAAIPAPPLEPFLAILDRLRRAAIRAAGPWARRLLVERERRVAILGAAQIGAAFLAACAVPLWMIALGPVVWGVPHILSDIRYLIVRPGVHRRPWILLAIAGGVAAAAMGYGLRGGLAAAAVALLFSRGTRARRAIGLAVVAALLAIAQWAGPRGDMAFAHLHNFVAVALWWAWRPRERRAHRLPLLPLLLFGACVAALLLGAARPLLALTGGLSAPWTGLSFRGLAASLSPWTRGPLAVRLVILYAFAQSVHYIVWMRLIPEDDRPSHTPRSYGQSYRVLRKDISGLLLWLSAAAVLVLCAWAAMTSLGHARTTYLSVAFFHGYLELAAAALLWSEGRLAHPAGAR